MTGTRRTAAAAAVLLVSAGLTGCSAPAARPLPGVSIRVLQYRSDIAVRQVQLEVVNGSAARITVASAALTGAGWEPALRWSDDDPAEIAPGVSVDLPVRLTAASCGPERAPRGLLRLADGTTRTVGVTDSHGTLAGLHARACFAQRVSRTGTVAFTGFRAGARGAAALLTVRSGRDVASGLTVDRVLPTPLLSPADGSATWTVGRRFTAGGTVSLPVVPTRCDLHAIAEDKVGSVLPVQVRLADGSSGTLDAVAPSALKDRILAWVVRTCRTRWPPPRTTKEGAEPADADPTPSAWCGTTYLVRSPNSDPTAELVLPLAYL